MSSEINKCTYSCLHPQCTYIIEGTIHYIQEMQKYHEKVCRYINREMNEKVQSTFPNLYDIIKNDDDTFMDEDTFQSKVDDLIGIGHIETSILDDIKLYTSRPGLNWSEFVHIDDPIKKKILLHFVENPTTFFVLMNTQSGKMRVAALELKKWGQDKTKKVVAFIAVSNDKTLADQSADGLEKTFGDQKLQLYKLSSNSKTSFDEIKTYIDAYANEPEYAMPLILYLANPKQNEKIVKLLHHIHKRVERNSKLRAGMIFDEADETYPRLRNKCVRIEGSDVSLSTYLVNNPIALYRLGFVTATDGDLLDEEYPECANAYLYPVEISPEDKEHYRALHHSESITHRVPFKSKQSHNLYAMKILDDNKEHFMTPYALPSGEVYYRKIIVNSNSQTKDMNSFAKECNKKGMYSLVFNGLGGTSVKLYIDGRCEKTFKTKNKKFNELLYYIYKKHKLNDKPLVIIGRRKVDRGLGFHYCPKINDKVEIVFEGNTIYSENRDGLVWTDIILGKIEDKNAASQKAGRAAGIIGNSPQYSGNTHYWTDQKTENEIRRHNTIVDTSNSMSGCSVLQAVTRANRIVPEAPIITNNHPNVIEHPTPFKTLDEVKDFLKKILNRNVNLKEFYEIDGYKLSTRLEPHHGKKKEELLAEDRLIIDEYNKITHGLNLSSNTGQNYMVYPVYTDINSKDVLYYVRYKLKL